MDENKLLRDLGRIAREDEAAEDARWERWERLNDGKLSAEEEAELLALARNSPEAEAALEAFRPLGPEFRTRVLAAVDAEAAKGKQRTRLRFVPWLWATAAAAGLVATAGLWLARLPATLPAYTWTENRAENAPIRGESAVEVLTRGDSFLATVQPEEPLRPETRVEVRCGIFSLNGPWIALPCDIAETFSKGAMKIAGRIPSETPLGPATIWIILGHAGYLPTIDTLGSPTVHAPPREKAWITLARAVEIRSR